MHCRQAAVPHHGPPIGPVELAVLPENSTGCRPPAGTSRVATGMKGPPGTVQGALFSWWPPSAVLAVGCNGV